MRVLEGRKWKVVGQREDGLVVQKLLPLSCRSKEKRGGSKTSPSSVVTALLFQCLSLFMCRHVGPPPGAAAS